MVLGFGCFLFAFYASFLGIEGNLIMGFGSASLKLA